MKEVDTILKLKYLFDNRDLAMMILKNWEYDPDSINLLNDYRISSNAVYPFKYKEQLKFLRFAPIEEKYNNNILGELEFISYLRGQGYPALSTVPSKNNKDLLKVSTPWGNYYAVVFEGVQGYQLEEIEYTEEICRKHGNYLGMLHKLSSEYRSKEDLHWSYEDVLDWIQLELDRFPKEELAREEVKTVRKLLSLIPKEPGTFGLIHYDFQLDNVFYHQQSDKISVIDFDDSMFHWYALDIQIALDSIISETPPQVHSKMKDIFIEGYKEEFDITDEMLLYMPLLKRFSNLYGYTRILRSAAEVWENEPEWLTNLREKLTNAMVKRSSLFGKGVVEGEKQK